MKTVVVPVARDGALVLPEEVRERLAGGTGGCIEFVVRENGRIEVRPHLPALAGVFGPLSGADSQGHGRGDRQLNWLMALSNAEGFKKFLSR